jgi:NAD(P)-dependent dehydrogenase (short-subunit alcohol dehydrogenase family)
MSELAVITGTTHGIGRVTSRELARYLALDPGVAGITGRYFDEYQLARAASPLANDVELQESLWKMSAAWTGAPTVTNERTLAS